MKRQISNSDFTINPQMQNSSQSTRSSQSSSQNSPPNSYCSNQPQAQPQTQFTPTLGVRTQSESISKYFTPDIECDMYPMSIDEPNYNFCEYPPYELPHESSTEILGEENNSSQSSSERQEVRQSSQSDNSGNDSNSLSENSSQNSTQEPSQQNSQNSQSIQGNQEGIQEENLNNYENCFFPTETEKNIFSKCLSMIKNSNRYDWNNRFLDRDEYVMKLNGIMDNYTVQCEIEYSISKNKVTDTYGEVYEDKYGTIIGTVRYTNENDNVETFDFSCTDVLHIIKCTIKTRFFIFRYNNNVHYYSYPETDYWSDFRDAESHLRYLLLNLD